MRRQAPPHAEQELYLFLGRFGRESLAPGWGSDADTKFMAPWTRDEARWLYPNVREKIDILSGLEKKNPTQSTQFPLAC